MRKIIGYFSSDPTWQLVTEKEYRKVFTHDLAIYYLKHEIYESVEREMKHILAGNAVGFYAGLRFLFPEVNHLAHLYWGHKGKNWQTKETRLVALYMKKFKIFYPEGGLYYKVFRHGLMHSHHPKWIRKNGKVGWYISNVAKIDDFGVFIPEFTSQIKASIDNFISKLEEEKASKKKLRLSNFLTALIDSGKILNKKDLRLYTLNRKKKAKKSK